MALSRKGRGGDHNETKWFDYDDDTQMLIARWDNDRYSVGMNRFRAVFQEKMRRLLDKAESGGDLRFTDDLAEVSGEEQTEFEAQCSLMARYILLDIRTKGREDGKFLLDDEAVAYDHEVGEELLRKDIELFMWVSSKAQQMQHDAYSLAKDAEKKP